MADINRVIGQMESDIKNIYRSVDEFKDQVKDDHAAINAKMDLLLTVYNQGRGAAKLAIGLRYAASAAIGLVSGVAGAWAVIRAAI